MASTFRLHLPTTLPSATNSLGRQQDPQDITVGDSSCSSLLEGREAMGPPLHPHSAGPLAAAAHEA